MLRSRVINTMTSSEIESAPVAASGTAVSLSHVCTISRAEAVLTVSLAEVVLGMPEVFSLSQEKSPPVHHLIEPAGLAVVLCLIEEGGASPALSSSVSDASQRVSPGVTQASLCCVQVDLSLAVVVVKFS